MHMMRISELNPVLRSQRVELWCIRISHTQYTLVDQSKKTGILGTAMTFVSKPQQIYMSPAAKGIHCWVNVHNVRKFTQLDRTRCFSIIIFNAIM